MSKEIFTCDNCQEELDLDEQSFEVEGWCNSCVEYDEFEDDEDE